MFDRIPLNLCLNRSIFNALLGRVGPEEYMDVKYFRHVDFNVANSLKFVLENDLTKFADTIQFYFTSTNEMNYSEVDLKPNGSTILVTNENKQEFARLKCHYSAYLSCKK